MTTLDTDETPQSRQGGAKTAAATIADLDDLRALIANLPDGDGDAADAIAERQAHLTKPPGSLGRLEEFAAWLGRWQGRDSPRLAHVQVLVFAGNHGVVERGVSAYPASVTAQMVANFEAGGAAINQICKSVGASLRVIPLDLDAPTADFTEMPATTEAEFLEAVKAGFDAVSGDEDLVCLGEMGIGNTTPAAAIAAALFGETPARWVGAGTGVDEEGLRRKEAAVQAGLVRHRSALSDPLRVAMCLGGRELAAVLGACLAARLAGAPVLLDGFISTAAAAPLAALNAKGLDHALIAHCSAEAGHRRLCAALGKRAVLDLDMRLGEGTGAALAVAVMRSALACHAGMATFDEAGVDDRD
jgi:nicotinate-nucleotide--dimethylbenzimidazole phosphoribosyltransferase